MCYVGWKCARSVFEMRVLSSWSARAHFSKCARSVRNRIVLLSASDSYRDTTDSQSRFFRLTVQVFPTRSPGFSSSQSRFFQFKVWFSVLSMARVFEGVGTVDGFHASFEPLAAAKLRHRTAKSDTILSRFTIFSVRISMSKIAEGDLCFLLFISHRFIINLFLPEVA